MFPVYKIKSNYEDSESKGTKEKYWSSLCNRRVLVKLKKYEELKDVRSYNVSEKIFSEITRYLGFSCVEVDFIVDENNRYGIASYDYKEVDNNMIIFSGDDLFFSVFKRKPNKTDNNNISKEDYSYNNIVKILLHYDSSGKLLTKFNSMMVIDALFGETDRHYENWGLFLSKNDTYDLLPLYDNSSCLLHQFRDENILNDIMNKKSLKKFSTRSICKISIDGKKYNHFLFIDFLLNNLPEQYKKELVYDIAKLKKLTDKYILELLDLIPNELCSDKHKKLIYEYITIRRDILLEMVNK